MRIFRILQWSSRRLNNGPKGVGVVARDVQVYASAPHGVCGTSARTTGQNGRRHGQGEARKRVGLGIVPA